MSAGRKIVPRTPVQPRVSVITIFYNAAEYIREAVDSVLAQDFGDFELLLVDDGSTDASTDIAKAYARRESERVRYLHHPEHENLGMSAARNLGLSEARGEFVAFIDADDRWRPWKLQEQVSLLDRMPEIDAVGGAVNYWTSHSGGEDRIVPTAHVRNRPIRPAEATLKVYPLGKAHAPSMSDLLFRKSRIAAVGQFEEAFAGPYEDQAFLAKFYLNSTLYVTNAVWSDYRLHPGSCMATVERDGTYPEARRQFLEWFERHLASTAHRDTPAIRRALNRALQRSRRAGTSFSKAARAALAGTFVGAMQRSARAALHRLGPIFAPGPAILMFHRVAEEQFDPWGLAISPPNFADQLSWIARNRTALPLSQFAELHRQGRLPRDAIALTFDDGYACNGEVAVPLLKRFALPATIFVPAELIERGNEFWWDELERIVLQHRGDRLMLYGHEVPVGEPGSDDREWEPAAPPRTERQRAYQRLWSLLYARTPSALQDGMTQLREQAKVPVKPRDSHRPLRPSEIQEIGSDLVEFGSHALTHASLPSLGPEQKAREISQSVDRCAELTGVRPRSFAYPYGDVAPDLAPLVQQAGFLCACRADGGFVRRRSDRFALPRIFVGNWDAAALARQLGRP